MLYRSFRLIIDIIMSELAFDASHEFFEELPSDAICAPVVGPGSKVSIEVGIQGSQPP